MSAERERRAVNGEDSVIQPEVIAVEEETTVVEQEANVVEKEVRAVEQEEAMGDREELAVKRGKNLVEQEEIVGDREESEDKREENVSEQENGVEGRGESACEQGERVIKQEEIEVEQEQIVPSPVSQRNREKFVHEGYMYTFAQFDHSKTIKFWRCDKRHSFGCKARLHTSVATNEVLKRVRDHCHEGDPDKAKVAAFRAVIKRRAEESLDAADVIIDEEYKNIAERIKSQLPSKQAMKNVINRKRASMQARLQ